MDIKETLINQLKKIVKFLNKQNIDYALAGGLAFSALVEPRATMDIDIIIMIKEEQLSGFTKFRNLNPGTYQTSCKIPANTFGSNTLYLSVPLVLPKTEHLVAQHILNFEVKFKGYNNIHLDYKTYFRPQLSWKLEKKPV